MPDLTTRTEPPGAVVIRPGTIASGRARGVAPLRREGPDKLTGAAKYADDLVFPGAWFGATIRSTDAHARFDALEVDPTFDWTKVVVVTAAERVVERSLDDSAQQQLIEDYIQRVGRQPEQVGTQ